MTVNWWHFLFINKFICKIFINVFFFLCINLIIEMTRHHGRFEGLFLIIKVKSSPSNDLACDAVLYNLVDPGLHGLFDLAVSRNWILLRLLSSNSRRRNIVMWNAYLHGQHNVAGTHFTHHLNVHTWWIVLKGVFTSGSVTLQTILIIVVSNSHSSSGSTSSVRLIEAHDV